MSPSGPETEIRRLTMYPEVPETEKCLERMSPRWSETWMKRCHRAEPRCPRFSRSRVMPPAARKPIATVRGEGADKLRQMNTRPRQQLRALVASSLAARSRAAPYPSPCRNRRTKTGRAHPPHTRDQPTPASRFSRAHLRWNVTGPAAAHARPCNLKCHLFRAPRRASLPTRAASAVPGNATV
jgi:hypothetical protein